MNSLLLPTQITISFFILSFLMYIGKDAGVYLPIITTIAGCWLPSPAQNLKYK